MDSIDDNTRELQARLADLNERELKRMLGAWVSETECVIMFKLGGMEMLGLASVDSDDIAVPVSDEYEFAMIHLIGRASVDGVGLGNWAVARGLVSGGIVEE